MYVHVVASLELPSPEPATPANGQMRIVSVSRQACVGIGYTRPYNPSPAGGDIGTWPRRQLQLSSIPVALTCGFYDGKIIADPAADEEALLSTTVSTVLDAQGRLLGARPRGLWLVGRGNGYTLKPFIDECNEYVLMSLCQMNTYIV